MPEPKANVVERTIDSIRKAIQNGQYAPGQRLIVADLVQELAVSAGPVREAIRRLTGEGLVDFVPNRGAMVRKLDARAISDIFRIREVIEGLAARLASENIDRPGNRDRLREEQKAGVAAAKAGGGIYIDHNRRFHTLIYEIADNDRLTEVAQQMTASIYRLNYHSLMDASYAKRSASDHNTIVRAILAGDGDAAEREMRAHIAAAGMAMQNAISTV